MRKFFIWCAGSNPELLEKCPPYEQTKHIGYGSLILVPATLALVSMTYALSTLSLLQDKAWAWLLGGIVWALFIFAFDRFIVSTHRRKTTNKVELKNPSFYLRLAFSLILGIAISHPLVLMYFDGSISDQIAQNQKQARAEIYQNYQQKIEEKENLILSMDSLFLEKQKDRDEQANKVAMEIDGEVLSALNGNKLTTGIKGYGPSAKQKIKQLNQLQSELESLKQDQAKEKLITKREINQLKHKADSAQLAFSISADYLQRELALEQLKQENSLVGLTQWVIIILFVLLDILPLIFKTFAPFGLYDKMLLDDSELVQTLDNQHRAKYLQERYESLSIQKT